MEAAPTQAAQVNWVSIKKTSQFSAMQPGTEVVDDAETIWLVMLY